MPLQTLQVSGQITSPPDQGVISLLRGRHPFKAIKADGEQPAAQPKLHNAYISTYSFKTAEEQAA